MKTKSLLHLIGLGAALLAFLSNAHAATHVVSISPSPNALQQLPSTTIVVQFDSAIDPATVTASSFLVWGDLTGRHAGSITFASGNTAISFVSSTPFSSGETVRIDVSSRIKDVPGAAISPWVSQFTVRSAASAAEFARGVVVANPGGNPFSVVAFDVNSDGKLDLVVGSGTTVNTVSVLLGHGDGTFATPVQYPTGGASGTIPWGVCVADVNGDGYGDILVSNYILGSGGSVSVLLGDGLGHFGPPTTYPVADVGAAHIAAGDLDGDGYMDIIVSDAPGPFQVFWNDGTGHFPTSVQVSGHDRGEGLAIGDVDGSGRLSVLSGDDHGGYCSVTINLGNRTFATPVKYDAGGGCRSAALADLNGDGTLDTVVGSWQANASFTTYTNQGNGILAGRADIPVNSSPGPWAVAVADYDGDGRPDVATANLNGGSIYSYRSVSIWHNSGGGAFDIRKDVDSGDNYPAGMVFGDFRGTGKLDLVTTHYFGSVTFLKNTTANVSGSAYADADENCAQNGPDEIGVGGQLVRLTDSSGVPRYEITREDGSFASVLPAGSYTANLVHGANSQEICNSGLGVTYNFTVGESTPKTGVVFGLRKKCAVVVSCASQVYTWPCPPSPPSPPCTHDANHHWRKLCPCEQFTYVVTVHNSGTSKLLAGSLVRLQLDQNVKFLSFPFFISSCAPVVGSVVLPGLPDLNPPCDPFSGGLNTGQLVQWTLGSDILVGNSCQFYVVVQVANVGLGTVLIASPSLIAQCSSGSSTVTTIGSTDRVLCSYDPNDKSVSPEGCGPFGNVVPGTPLTYRVQFQNLGNAPAGRVLVRDLLDPALDPNTIQILSTSHALTSFKTLPGQEMIWTFDNINLPAAISEEAGSHGEIIYSVLPKSSAAEGTTILNTAFIYFDQNPPVITATTTNTIRNVPMPDAGFSSVVLSTNGPWVFNFTYTGGTADGASFAWDLGTDPTPFNPTNQNVNGISYATEGPKLITLVVTRYGCQTTNQMVVWAGPCEGIPTLSVSRSTNQVVVSWTDCGILQVAESITGPWQDVLARTPYTNEISARQRFYRTRK